VLETRLLRHSGPHLTDEDFSDLKRIQDQFGAAIRSGDAAQWGLLNAELHMALYRHAGLPRTASIVANLLTASERYTRLQLAGEAQWRRAEVEHGDLIALCRMRDHESACAVLERHIAQVHADLSAMMGRRSAAT
jgi:DNA-binding GntR family transcriptional regulator